MSNEKDIEAREQWNNSEDHKYKVLHEQDIGQPTFCVATTSLRWTIEYLTISNDDMRINTIKNCGPTAIYWNKYECSPDLNPIICSPAAQIILKLFVNAFGYLGIYYHKSIYQVFATIMKNSC